MTRPALRRRYVRIDPEQVRRIIHRLQFTQPRVVVAIRGAHPLGTVITHHVVDVDGAQQFRLYPGPQRANPRDVTLGLSPLVHCPMMSKSQVRRRAENAVASGGTRAAAP